MTKEEKVIYDKTRYKNNKDIILVYHKEYDQKNKDKRNKWQNDKYHSNIIHKLKKNISSNINISLLKNKFKKNSRTTEILGCSIEEFKNHLESQFESWMNWDNHGGRVVEGENTTWDIDHIIPLSSSQTKEELFKLHHYSNTQPLCSLTNRHIKRDN